MTVFELPTRAYGGYIFDCDGTLADSMPVHHRAWKRALASAGAPFEFPWALFVKRAGMTLEVTVEELNVEFGCDLDPVAVAAAQRAEYAALIPTLQPVEPVVEFLRSVAATHPVSVASGSDFPTVDATLVTLGIRALVPLVVTAFDVPRGKPFPDLFLLAAERMGVAPAACLVFEDSRLGIEAATRAGMSSVLVTPVTHTDAARHG